MIPFGILAASRYVAPPVPPLTFRGGGIDYRNSVNFLDPTMQFDVGPPSPTRMVCVAVAASVNNSPLSATIGGVPAVLGMHNGTGAYGASYFALANVPDGSLVTAIIEMSVAQGWCGMAAWTTPDLREFGSQGWAQGGSYPTRSVVVTPENSDDIIVATAKVRQQPEVALGFDPPVSTRPPISISSRHIFTGDLSSVGSLAGTPVTVKHNLSVSSQGHAMAAAVLRKV